jgi:hypothetical protein
MTGPSQELAERSRIHAPLGKVVAEIILAMQGLQRHGSPGVLV